MQYKFDKHLQSLLPDRPLKFLAAVSGGADSMCLLNLLCGSSLDLDISIAHMNFSLRGEESDADEALVREWAAANGVEIFVKKVDTLLYAKGHSISVEMAARELRYNWFEMLRNEHGFDYILLAHHANDNAETLLLNMLRGSGLRGICGMKALDEKRRLLRPLLWCTRAEIDKYVAKKSIPFRTDRTNADVKFHRNRIRNVIVPEMEKINPNAIATLNRDMGYFSSAEEILSDLAAQKRNEIAYRCKDGNYPFIANVRGANAKKFVALNSASALECAIGLETLLKEKHYAFWLYEILSEYGFNSAQVEDLSGSLFEPAPKRVASETHTAIKERGYIKVYKGAVEKREVNAVVEEFNGSVSVVAGKNRIRLSVYENMGGGNLDEISKPEYADADTITLYVSVDTLKYPLELRSIKAGDKWRPFGMKGLKTISDYLTDIKMDSALKGEILVLCSPDNIICLPGLEISDFYKVCAESRRILRIDLTIQY